MKAEWYAADGNVEWTGIEPVNATLKDAVLPLNYHPIKSARAGDVSDRRPVFYLIAKEIACSVGGSPFSSISSFIVHFPRPTLTNRLSLLR